MHIATVTPERSRYALAVFLASFGEDDDQCVLLTGRTQIPL
jgi:hypothetical protein